MSFRQPGGLSRSATGLVGLLASVGLLQFITGSVIAQNAEIGSEFDTRPEQFSLFGSVDAVDDPEEDNSASSRRGARQRGTSAAPEFVLLGTSRIGNRYSAILRNQNGSEVVVVTEPGGSAVVEGFASYSIVEVASGKVSLQYPASRDCVEFPEQGVTCSATGNIATLALSRGAPLPRTVTPVAEDQTVSSEEGEVVVSEDNPVEPTNPFAALRARALQQNGDAPVSPAASPRRAFTPRRIDPADVPPGYRVVSTPFGDRLVRE